MGRIQATTGLFSGVPIQDTVAQLLKIEARPRDLLVSRTNGLAAEFKAVTELTASVLAVQFAAEALNKATLFEAKAAESSDPNRLKARVTGKPETGVHTFTPIQQALSHQLLSSSLGGPEELVGEGEFAFRFGGFLDQGISLDELNAGGGFDPGKIRITDRTGASAVIDLTAARTLDDVLAAINGNDAIGIEARAEGDRIRISDTTGASVANLKVQDVSGGAAASLGLDGVDAAASTALGDDLLSLHADMRLDQLNDGAGVSLRDALPDLEVTFRDGSTPLSINFTDEKTLGELLATINAAAPTKLKAEIAPDGDRLTFTDLTTDSGGTFTVTSPLGGSAAEDLGLATAAVGGVISGRRLVGGLKTTLLSSLAGGQGATALGLLSVANRSGGAAQQIDLSTAETLDDVVRLINAAGAGVTASLNPARNGLRIVDTTGQSASNLVISSGDAANTAQKLKIAINAAQSSVDSGSLDRQYVSETTRLDSLRGGQGIDGGSFVITDSQGVSTTIRPGLVGIETVGDLVESINALASGVEARINARGDGIVLIDVAGGAGELQVRDVGSGRAAANLGLLGEVEEVEFQGQTRQAIVGADGYRVQIGAEDTLSDVIAKINSLGAGVRAFALRDGAGANDYRISLSSLVDGKAGELLVDTRLAPFSFTELSPARDALLRIGASENGVLASSPTNTFEDVLDGVALDLVAAGGGPVTVSINPTDSSLISAVDLFATQYNKLVEKLDSLTFFNETDNSEGVLFGSLEALRVETELSGLLSGRIFGAGEIQAIGELGLSFREDGKLSFNPDELEARFAADPEAVQKFFTEANTGLAARLGTLFEQLAGEDNSLLTNRVRVLQDRMDANNARVDFLNARLLKKKDFLLNQFYAMELAIGKMQNAFSIIAQIQAIPPL